MNSSGIDHHRLSPTKVAAPGLCNIQLVTKRGRFPANRFGNELFDTNVASLERSLRETACLESFLNGEAIIRNAGDELGMSLRLIEAAHDSKADANAILFHERRNDGVQWPLARSQRVRVICFHREKSSPVVQHEACARCNDSGAKVAVIALNQRHDIAVLVDGAQVNGVLTGGIRVALEACRFDVASRFVHIDKLRTFGAMRL